MDKKELEKIIEYGKINDLMDHSFKEVFDLYSSRALCVKIVNKSINPLPEYKTLQSAGMDLQAAFIEGDGKLYLQPGKRTLIHTGLYIQLPVGYEAQVRPRSGLALKYGVTVLNSPGTIDADYRGEICVILYNAGDEPFVVYNGDRIAQLVIAKYETAHWLLTNSLDETERADGGFGHSGVK